MIGLALITALAAFVIAVAFGPWFVGWRTTIYNYSLGFVGIATTLITLFESSLPILQGFDWTQYVSKPVAGGIGLGLAIVGQILRHRTTGPVGES